MCYPEIFNIEVVLRGGYGTYGRGKGERSFVSGGGEGTYKDSTL